MLLEPGLFTDDEMGPTPPVKELETANTAASACRGWLEIIFFRIISSTRRTPNLMPISIRAAVARRAEGLSEVTIKGVARHPRILGHVRFRWDTTIIDTPTFRSIGERVGTGQFQYLNLTRAFMLESSRDGALWLRMLTARGEPSSIRYSMGRGKMTPRSVDYE
jgi:hypothetical protein